jgi:hypothetical protein
MAVASAIAVAGLLVQAAPAAAEDSRPVGVVQPNEAFAGLPFPKWVAPDLRMSSGWFIAEDEKKIVGEGHQSLDFEGPVCGTPILAIADGWAVASYQSGVERGGTAPYNPANPSDTSTDWKDPVTGKQGWLGYSGLFVELQTKVQIPGFQNAVAQYFHLAAVNPRITWLDPVRLDDTVTWDGKHVANWYPQPITQSQDAIRKIATPVKKGDVIGWMGDTGINFGFNDNLDPQHHVVWPRNRAANPPWDPQGAGATTPIWRSCQLHIQFYSGRTPTGSKLNWFDGFDKYDRITGVPGTPSYHNPDNPQPGKFVMGPNPIFQRDRSGNAVYAG